MSHFKRDADYLTIPLSGVRKSNRDCLIDLIKRLSPDFKFRSTTGLGNLIRGPDELSFNQMLAVAEVSAYVRDVQDEIQRAALERKFGELLQTPEYDRIQSILLELRSHWLLSLLEGAPSLEPLAGDDPAKRNASPDLVARFAGESLYFECTTIATEPSIERRRFKALFARRIQECMAKLGRERDLMFLHNIPERFRAAESNHKDVVAMCREIAEQDYGKRDVSTPMGTLTVEWETLTAEVTPNGRRLSSRRLSQNAVLNTSMVVPVIVGADLNAHDVLQPICDAVLRTIKRKSSQLRATGVVARTGLVLQPADPSWRHANVVAVVDTLLGEGLLRPFEFVYVVGHPSEAARSSFAVMATLVHAEQPSKAVAALREQIDKLKQTSIATNLDQNA